MTDYMEHLNDSEFEELRKVYYCQAYESVENIQDLLLALDADPHDCSAIKSVKRHVHTLKGDSNAIGLAPVGGLCHAMEDLISFIMEGPDELKHECTDLLLSGLDIIGKILSESESGTIRTGPKEIMEKMASFLKHGDGKRKDFGAGPSPNGHQLTEYQLLQIQEAASGGLIVYEVEVVFHPRCADRGLAAYMVTHRLNGLGMVIRSIPDPEGDDIDCSDRMTVLLGAGGGIEELRKGLFIGGITDEIKISEFICESGKLETGAHATGAVRQKDPDGVRNEQKAVPVSAHAVNGMLRIEASRVDRIMDLTGELIIGRSMIEQAARDLESGAPRDYVSDRLFAIHSYMERTVSDLQKGINKMRMVPINHVFRKFPKIVRDLTAEKGKKARLDIQGRETELDKGIVEALGEPLAHIIRNMVDHGIEDPDSRKSKGKPEEGVITLRAYHEAAQIVIEVSDDGKGIDRERLRQKAIEKGFVSCDDAERMSESEALGLIFVSGLSTSESLSETSGRGVGMDAVKSAVEAMKGSIEVESMPSEGTMFRLRLPLTLAVIKALLFDVAGRLYAIPMSAIADVTRVVMSEIETVDGKDTIIFRDRIISVIRLHELFNVETEECKKSFVLVLAIGSRKVGVMVDSIRGQQELVVKAVDGSYTKSDLVTGASILGDGKVVLILDAPAIFRKAVEDERKGTVSTWEG